MRKLIYLSFLLALPAELLAQANYVATTANSSIPGNLNTIVGPGAALNTTTGSYNAFLGSFAGYGAQGSYNVFLGSYAGFNNYNTGSNDTFTGYQAGYANTTGGSNVFMGSQAGYSNKDGSQNAFLGFQAGYLNTSGGLGTFVGYKAGYSNTIGGYNTFLGEEAGYTNQTGSYNAFLGYAAGYYNTTGYYNAFLGYGAGLFNSTGYSNVALGVNAAYNNQTGSNNVMLGDSAGLKNTVSNNVFVGSKAGFSNQTNKLNTYLGFQTGYNAVADSNTFVGYRAGYQNTSGQGNTFFGVNAGRNISTGSHNTIIGNKAGPASVNSNDNVYVGFNTGQHDRGSQNTLIGNQTDVLTAQASQPLHHATAIGYGAVVSVSHAVVLGQQANVGIGTSAPTARLHIRSPHPNESGIRLENLTDQSPAMTSTNRFLSVDSQGNVVLGRYRVQVSRAEEWSDQVFGAGYRLRPLSEVAAYIETHQHLPGVPSAQEMVSRGMDGAQLNAKLLEKIEELTLYLIELKNDNALLHQENKLIRKQLRAMKPGK